MNDLNTKKYIKPILVSILCCLICLGIGSTVWAADTEGGSLEVQTQVPEKCSLTVNIQGYGGVQIDDAYNHTHYLYDETQVIHITTGTDFTIGFLSYYDIEYILLDTQDITFDIDENDRTYVMENFISDATITVAYGQNAEQGDINADGSIDAIDALQALRHAVKQITLYGNTFVRANVDTSDDQVNAKDALMILQKSVGLI